MKVREFTLIFALCCGSLVSSMTHHNTTTPVVDDQYGNAANSVNNLVPLNDSTSEAGAIQEKIFCRDTIKECHFLGGYCLNEWDNYKKSGLCGSNKIFPAFNHCPSCYCCIPIGSSSSSTACKTTTPQCHQCGGRCGSCSTIERPYANLCGSASCNCCVPPCQQTFSCKTQGGHCIGEDKTCIGTKTNHCEGYGCQCCIPPPAPKPPAPTKKPHEPGPYPVPYTCEWTAKCDKKKGECTFKDQCIGSFKKRFCGKGGCGCCNPSTCPTTSECKKKGGQCSTRKECPTEYFTTQFCDSYGCGCCFLDDPGFQIGTDSAQCDTTKKCLRKNGHCCSKESCVDGIFNYKFCSIRGENCGCCMKPKCRAKKNCDNAGGECKSKCGPDDLEIPKGCKGKGCKCCVIGAGVTCTDSKWCARKGGICCSKEACGKGKFFEKQCGKGCGCCINKW